MLTGRIGLDWMIVAVLAFVGWHAPQLGTGWLIKIETYLGRFAGHRRLAIAVIFLLPILIRLSLLPLLPLQPPYIHDEYSYLLGADTFSHGRLTNPAHPMWMFFDTFHVLQQPTYASKYPPAQAAVLALGELLGHPWMGVLLSMGAMCAAYLWMLQGWLPARWALLGSILVLTRFAIFSYWMNSYWGGGVAALGGALVMGAVPRILRKPQLRDAVVLGLGAGILANSRPLEGFILCVPVAILILHRVVQQRGSSLRRMLLRVVLPATAVIIFAASFTLYYNWRVTTDPFLFPHVLNSKTYETVPMFVWEELKPPRTYMNPQFDVFYNTFERKAIPRNWEQRQYISLQKLRWSYDFFLGPALILPFAALWPVFASSRTRFLILQILFCLTGALAVIWFLPHYLAPVMATLFIILVQALRYLRTWQSAGRSVGIGLTRAVVISALLMPLLPVDMNTRARFGPFAQSPGNWERERITRDLEGTPEDHLVIVRYSRTRHNVHQEWVYNRADIDRAKIVWAREIPGMSSQPLLNYFKGRKFWLVEPEADPVQIKPYIELPSHKYE